MSNNYFNQKVFDADGSLKLLSDDVREIIKDYLKDNLKIRLSRKKILDTTNIEIIIALDGDIIAKESTFI